jgi:Flp pilus assembly protein TadD
MTRKENNKPMIGLAVTTALASIALAGCTTHAAPRADTSFGKAQVALSKGKVDQAVTHAEAAVLAEPRNANYRALLGAAYLEAGRFQAAATSFDDALELGDSDPRTVLSYALAEVALGDNGAAIAALDQWQDDIDPADLGLAYALAGQPDRGVHVLANALRGGQNTAKVRQNLAYAYALQGNWRAARVMAAEDVPADQIDTRISEWAQSAQPEAFQLRVANLLQVSPAQDSGQPAHLALANHPAHAVMVAEAAAQVPVDDVAAQEPAQFAFAEPVNQAAARPASFETAFISDEPEVYEVPAQERFTSRPVVQQTPAVAAAPAKPAARVAAASSQRRMAATTEATHLVQLGSFSSRAGAERATGVYQKRYSQLSGRDFVITEAKVNGKTYFRVAAAGFGATSARSMCSTVKASGKGCFAYAEGKPLPGAVSKPVRMAAR